MDIILITTAVITVIGAIVGAGLVFTGKKFHVEVDEREAAVREVLPGNNCGACGYAGCDAMAAAIAKGEAPVGGCPVGGTPVAQKIGAIMGTEAGAVVRKLAFVKCKGSCEFTENQGGYVGIPDCASAVRAGLALTSCDYGCVGLGSCVKACPEDAISVQDGVAVVDRNRCVGCGLCAKACPKGLIELVPEDKLTAVQCSNRDKGPQVKKVCSAGCIGCSLCVRQCEQGAVTVENNLAHINYESCVQCGKCAEKCPAKVITTPATMPSRRKASGQKGDKMDKKTIIWKVVCSLLIVAAAVLLLSGVLNGSTLYHLGNRGDLGPLTRSDIKYVTVKAPAASSQDGTVSAKDWETVFPNIARTMKANADNAEVTDYLEQDPYLVNLYEGFGFAKDYGSARGHEYCLTDVGKTQRPHALANCLTCKTPNFAKLVNDEGVQAYKYSFDEAMAKMEESVSCYTCHGNDAGSKGQITLTHSYVKEALGDNAEAISQSTLSCGQCHIEYYFTVADAETMMPYDSVAAMTPEAILAYYDSIENKDGELGFYDWVQPSTGAKMLKAQHPELETYLTGKHAAMGMSCADCHMEIVMEEDGEVYHSHYIDSPLNNETLLSTCASCHGDTDMKDFVKKLQARITARETDVGNKLSAFKDALAEAVQAAEEGAPGARTQEELDAVRKLYREAQWFFDFDYVENAEGAHNSDLATRCLDTAEAKIAEGLALLGIEN